MSESKKGLIISIVTLVLFNILIILLKFVDVKEVGLSGFNNTYLHEYNKALDIISDILLYLSIGAFVAVVVYFIYKLIKNKGKNVDYILIVYFLCMVIVVITYLVFEFFVKVNGRPYEPSESSFPSTHILLTTYILLPITTLFFKKDRDKETKEKFDLETGISLIAFIIIGVEVILRFWSGMHWITDCLGGLILGVFYFGVYYFVISLIKDKKSQE